MIGGFNVSTKGHGACISHMLKFGKPLILVGGGGYTVENVARYLNLSNLFQMLVL